MPLHCIHSRGFMAIVYDFLPAAVRGQGVAVQKGTGHSVRRNNTFRNTLVAILPPFDIYVFGIREIRCNDERCQASSTKIYDLSRHIECRSRHVYRGHTNTIDSVNSFSNSISFDIHLYFCHIKLQFKNWQPPFKKAFSINKWIILSEYSKWLLRFLFYKTSR